MISQKVLLTFTSFSVVLLVVKKLKKKKNRTCLLLGKKKRSYIGFKIKYINDVGDIFYSLMGTFEWRYEDNGKREKWVSGKGTYRLKLCGDRTKNKDWLSEPLYFSFSHFDFMWTMGLKGFCAGDFKNGPTERIWSYVYRSWFFFYQKSSLDYFGEKRRMRRMKTKMRRKGKGQGKRKKKRRKKNLHRLSVH